MTGTVNRGASQWAEGLMQWVQEHPLAGALVLSAIFHAVLLWKLPGMRGEGREQQRVLQVSMFETPEPKPAVGKPLSRVREVARKVPPRSVMAPEPRAAEPQAESAREIAPTPPAVLTAPVGAREAPPMVEAMRAPEREEFDQNLLTSYGQTLSRLLARNQNYPRLAQIRHWEGMVRLRVVVAKKGTVASVVITQSSGYDVLDERAVEMVKGASPLPELPEGLRGREFSIIVPVMFRLERS
jgi:periplasmic protein TonB